MAEVVVKSFLMDGNACLVGSAQKIEKGNMVGSNAGYARELAAGDTFLGHAKSEADNTSGGNGAMWVDLEGPGEYCQQVTITSVAVTDIGASVYADTSTTYTLTSGQNSIVGKVVQYVTTNTAIVKFEPVVRN